MLNRIKGFVQEWSGAAGASGQDGAHDELQVAVAALLVEAATMDSDFDADERAAIGRLLRARFGLEERDAQKLVALAEAHIADAAELYGFTRIVKDRFSHDERVEMMQMLWEVAYADGELHDYEANLMRRMAGLIFVSDRESGEARKRALAHLGLSG